MKVETPGNGGVAQLGEHLPCKQGVMGSNPIISTSAKLAHPKRGEVQRRVGTSNPDEEIRANFKQEGREEQRTMEQPNTK